jgi:signal transduction histidine kinase
VSGDPRLIERLVTNLVENALYHNLADGRVALRVQGAEGAATLTVWNTGPVVPAGELERLLQPFQRLERDRTRHHAGFGLGLSIVAAVAAAHDAGFELGPRPEGGLEVSVRFSAFPAGRVPPAIQPLPALSAD